MVTSIKAQTDYTCALAAIESLSVDKHIHTTQTDIINRFPVWCGKKRIDASGQHTEGGIGLLEFFHILNTLTLASSFVIGFGKSFVRTHFPKVDDGIFLHTMNHPNGQHGGFHCWRLADIHSDYFLVADNNKRNPDPYSMLQWDYLENLACVVVVCIP